MIEVRDLFTHDEIFQQRRTARTGAQRVLIVGDARALVGRKGAIGAVFAICFELVKFGVMRLRGFQAAWRGRLFARRRRFGLRLMRTILGCQRTQPGF